MSLKIKNQKGDVEMDWCCETLDKYISGGKLFVLDSINGRAGVFLRTGGGFPMVAMIQYCPFCGERTNITKDPNDDVLKEPGKPIRPRYWDDETDSL